MSELNLGGTQARAAGYEALIARYELAVIPNWHRSFVATSGPHRIEMTAGITEEVLTSKYWPGDSLGDHLEFALKYDGTNLAILASLFQVVPQTEFLAYVNSKPTGKYARRLWFVYELLTGTTLPLDDLKQGNYVDLLDAEQYYTIAPRARSVVRGSMTICWATVGSVRRYGAPMPFAFSRRPISPNAVGRSHPRIRRNF